MKTVLIYSLLLCVGLILSQFLSTLFGDSYPTVALSIHVLTMIALAYIMIHVGFAFQIDKSNPKKYCWDYFVAFTAASLPWLFVGGYFIFALLPAEYWANLSALKGVMIISRFAAPTSAGVLFSMLAAAGLAASWTFKKARILAIFDDLDTVLLIFFLKMLFVGIAWQLIFILFAVSLLLYAGWRYLHTIKIPHSWPWVLSYSAIIVAICELIYFIEKSFNSSVPLDIEVLLPAFILGCVIKIPAEQVGPSGKDLNDGRLKMGKRERIAAILISASFMLFVGLSMPPFFTSSDLSTIPLALTAEKEAAAIFNRIDMPSWHALTLHVLLVTILSNLGKMFPFFCYRDEAHWRERLAVAIGMFPRGEVGVGIIAISLNYQLGGPIISIAVLSLVLNLLLTGVFIAIVHALVSDLPKRSI